MTESELRLKSPSLSLRIHGILSRQKPALPQRKAVLRLGKHSRLKAGTIFSRPGPQNTQLVATQVCAAAEGSGQRAGLPQTGLPRLPLARSSRGERPGPGVGSGFLHMHGTNQHFCIEGSFCAILKSLTNIC